MKFVLPLFIALLFCADLRSADAQDTKYFYARDAQTEIELSPSGDGGSSFEFRVYGGVREGRVVYHGLPTELTFTVVDAHRVRIDGKNTSAHHGARAYFDGMYLKTGTLKKPVEVD